MNRVGIRGMNPVSVYVVDDYLLTRIAQRRYFQNDEEINFLEDFSCAEDCIEKIYRKICRNTISEGFRKI